MTGVCPRVLITGPAETDFIEAGFALLPYHHCPAIVLPVPRWSMWVGVQWKLCIQRNRGDVRRDVSKKKAGRASTRRASGLKVVPDFCTNQIHRPDPLLRAADHDLP